MTLHISRYICDVFTEMRAADKSKNYSYLIGLIEEAQVLANRMEASLEEKQDLEWHHERTAKAEKESKKLEEQVLNLKNQIKFLKTQKTKLIKKNKNI